MGRVDRDVIQLAHMWATAQQHSLMATYCVHCGITWQHQHQPAALQAKSSLCCPKSYWLLIRALCQP